MNYLEKRHKMESEGKTQQEMLWSCGCPGGDESKELFGSDGNALKSVIADLR